MTVKLKNPDSKGNDKEVSTGGFSFLGFLFQSLLYLGHGLRKKALIIFVVWLFSLVVIELITTNPEEVTAFQQGVGAIVALYCGFSFNSDYYKYLKAKGWKEVEATK